jgi:aminopeptidase N
LIGIAGVKIIVLQNHRSRNRGEPLRRLSFITACIILLSAFGCSGVKMAAPPTATLRGVPHPFRNGQIVDLNTGKAISLGDLIHQISSNDLVFLGEDHDNPDHHLIEVQILQALADASVRFTLGMEFFQKKQQTALNRYLERELSEDEFLKETAWEENWGFDYHLYRPLLLFARQNAIRVIALNAPPEIVMKVGAHGLKALDTKERSQVAQDIDLTNGIYRTLIKAAYDRHPKDELKSFEYFYEAQCVWDETMAENLAGYLKRRDEKVIVFSGNGHVQYKFGIPDRTLRRHPVPAATIVLLPLRESTALEKGMADYVWLTAECFHQSMRLH